MATKPPIDLSAARARQRRERLLFVSRADNVSLESLLLTRRWYGSFGKPAVPPSQRRRQPQ